MPWPIGTLPIVEPDQYDGSIPELSPGKSIPVGRPKPNRAIHFFRPDSPRYLAAISSVPMFEERWKEYLKVWDATLARNRFAAGKAVTIADFALYGTVARTKGILPALCESVPNVDRWLGEIGARPAVQRAMKF